MILDLFSHKIHSSGNEWPEKLAELAVIFAEFDGRLFDRDAFERRLQRISPRASYIGHAAASPRTPGGRLDVSKFRDEISAYPSYLGLYFLEQSDAGWIVRLSETAKRFLVREEPDVASFLRVQLPLFQYPNAMGAAYRSHTNQLRIQGNARDRTLEFVRKGIHFSPVRMIVMALKADSALRSVSVLDASITFDEIFGLANHPPVNRDALPPIEAVSTALDGIRRGRVGFPRKYESRFHTLRHTEMFLVGRSAVRLRRGVNEADSNQLMRQLEAIASIRFQFDGFDRCRTGEELEEVIASGEWGRYFDGVKILPAHVVDVLTSDEAIAAVLPVEPREEGVLPLPIPSTYPFRYRTTRPTRPAPYDRSRELADPEVTRIKRQRRNLVHKELIDKMERWIRRLGARPKENDHIDMLAKIPRNGSFLFEMKSGGENLLDQIRKGLSQLYEYRYRYRDAIDDDHIALCLVLAENPTSIPWVTDYLCNDRNINLCWFDDEEVPVWPTICEESMIVLRSEPLMD